MTAVELLSILAERDVRLELVGGRLHYDAPTGVLTPELRKLLTIHKAAIVDLLGRRPACLTCGSTGRCYGRITTADGGWACRAAVEAGLIHLEEEQRGRRQHLEAGWSAGVAIPC